MAETHVVYYDYFRHYQPEVVTKAEQVKLSARLDMPEEDHHILFRGSKAECEAFMEGYIEAREEFDEGLP